MKYPPRNTPLRRKCVVVRAPKGHLEETSQGSETYLAKADFPSSRDPLVPSQTFPPSILNFIHLAPSSSVWQSRTHKKSAITSPVKVFRHYHLIQAGSLSSNPPPQSKSSRKHWKKKASSKIQSNQSNFCVESISNLQLCIFLVFSLLFKSIQAETGF